MTQVRISDLSVGDWVQDILGNICIVRNIFCGDLVECYVVKKGDELGIMIDRLRPILITAEVLEKNGFRKNGKYNEFNIGEWNENPFIGVSLDRQSLRVRHYGNDIFIEGKVLFVHQLQHALRLAGIEKEIEL